MELMNGRWDYLFQTHHVIKVSSYSAATSYTEQLNSIIGRSPFSFWFIRSSPVTEQLIDDSTKLLTLSYWIVLRRTFKVDRSRVPISTVSFILQPSILHVWLRSIPSTTSTIPWIQSLYSMAREYSFTIRTITISFVLQWEQLHPVSMKSKRWLHPVYHSWVRNSWWRRLPAAI